MLFGDDPELDRVSFGELAGISCRFMGYNFFHQILGCEQDTEEHTEECSTGSAGEQPTPPKIRSHQNMSRRSVRNIDAV